MTSVDVGGAEVGSAAPAFTLRDQHGSSQSLADRRGSRNVLLVFYPFAFTGVCTGEMRALSDNAAQWERLGTDVLAVSCDSVPALRAFSDAESLELPVLSDFWPHGAVSSSYATFNADMGAAERSSFVIDREGVVRWTVRTAIPDARDISDYLRVLDPLVS